MTRPRLSYANVVSSLALVLVVSGGGVAVAGGALKKNSVGSRQITNGQVKTRDLGAGAVTGAKVVDDALTGDDIREDTLVLPEVPDVPQVVTVATPKEDFASVLADVEGESADRQLLTIDAPAAGLVVVSVGAEFNAGDDINGFVYGQVVPDGDEGDAADFEWDTGDADGWFDHRQQFSAVFEVDAGEHTYVLRLSEFEAGAPSQVYGTQMIAQWTAGSIDVPVITRRSAPSRGGANG